jgi:two-component system, NtrC family, sensor kinase
MDVLRRVARARRTQAQASRGTSPAVRPSGRIHHRVLLSFVALVTVTLGTSTLLEARSKYDEIQRLAVQIQHEKASAAAQTISASILDIERQIGWATPPGLLSIDERLDDFRRLLRQAPSITEVAYVDAAGREQLFVSRVSTNRIRTGIDRSDTPAFTEAALGRPYFSSVYLRADTEPYITVSVVDPGGRGGVTVAEMTLRGISQVISGIRVVGTTGSAYLVDDNGRLIAHPDLALVLRGTSMATLPHVAAAQRLTVPSGTTSVIGRDLHGREVLASIQKLPQVNWMVVVEQPVDEAFQPVFASMQRSLLIFVAMLGLALIGGFLLARRITQPVEALRRGVADLRTGALPHGVSVRTGDELEVLANDFNAMATELAATIEELKRTSRELELASLHKSEFLANMAHEVRAPLNAVIGFSEVLLQQMFGPVNEKQAEYLRDILDSGRHLLALINDILDLSKVEAGQMDLERSTFWLPEVVQSAVHMFRETAIRREVDLQLKVADDVGEIEADLRRIRQVLFNLLSNAIKFTGAGGRVDVRASLRDDVVEIRVVDTGVGINGMDQERIFEPFQQAGDHEAAQAEGTGLGLSIVRRFVELHGGRIWVESEPGKGSAFAFQIPVQQPAGTASGGKSDQEHGRDIQPIGARN